MTVRRTKIFFDGGCRPNPGPIEVAVVAGGASEGAFDRDWPLLWDAFNGINRLLLAPPAR